MSVSKALFYLLTTNSTVASYVSNGDDTFRVHPLTAYIEEHVPYITIQEITNNPNNTKNAPSSVDSLTVQINVIHDNYDGVKILCNAVRSALDYQQGTFNGVEIQHISFQGSNDVYEDNVQLNGGVMVQQEYLVRMIND
jgi:hypothetical protein